jgi:hypothetical protein
LAKFAGAESFVIPGADNSTVFQLQICNAVTKPRVASCPANQAGLQITNGVCTSIGDIRTLSVDMVPSKNGLMLTYYHGAPFNSVAFVSSRVYFECDKTAGKGTPVYEHFHNCQYGAQHHFMWKTNAVCQN